MSGKKFLSESNKDNWILTTSPNYIVFIFDILSRVGILFLFWDVWHKKMPEDLKLSFLIVLFVLMQIVVLLITFYIAKRKRSTLEAFIEQRVLSYREKLETGFRKKDHVTYKKADVKLGVPKLNDDFFLTAIIILVSCCATVIFGIFFRNYVNQDDWDLVYIICLLLPFFLFLLLFNRNKIFFVTSKIVSVQRNEIQFVGKEKTDFIFFLSDDSQRDTELYEQNDLLIAEKKTQIDIYHERLKSLSYEAVFIGALTFATFIQLTSPENIDVIYKHIAYGQKNVYHKVTSDTENDTQGKGWTLRASKKKLEEEIPKSLLFYPSKLISSNQKESDSMPNQTNKNQSLSSPSPNNDVHSDDDVITFTLLIIGSLLSSSFYVIVLLKKFAVAKSIYKARESIDKASIWNIREEKYLEKEQLSDNSSDKEKNKLEVLTATDRIQIELAKSSSLIQNIGSNLRFSEATRHLGLYCFFSVLLIGALFLHQFIALFVLFTAIYGVLASYLIGYNSKDVLIKFKEGKANY